MENLGTTGPNIALKPLQYGICKTDQGVIVLMHNMDVNPDGVSDRRFGTLWTVMCVPVEYPVICFIHCVNFDQTVWRDKIYLYSFWQLIS